MYRRSIIEFCYKDDALGDPMVKSWCVPTRKTCERGEYCCTELSQKVISLICDGFERLNVIMCTEWLARKN